MFRIEVQLAQYLSLVTDGKPRRPRSRITALLPQLRSQRGVRQGCQQRGRSCGWAAKERLLVRVGMEGGKSPCRRSGPPQSGICAPPCLPRSRVPSSPQSRPLSLRPPPFSPDRPSSAVSTPSRRCTSSPTPSCPSCPHRRDRHLPRVFEDRRNDARDYSLNLRHRLLAALLVRAACTR